MVPAQRSKTSSSPFTRMCVSPVVRRRVRGGSAGWCSELPGGAGPLLCELSLGPAGALQQCPLLRAAAARGRSEAHQGERLEAASPEQCPGPRHCSPPRGMEGGLKTDQCALCFPYTPKYPSPVTFPHSRASQLPRTLSKGRKPFQQSGGGPVSAVRLRAASGHHMPWGHARG